MRGINFYRTSNSFGRNKNDLFTTFCLRTSKRRRRNLLCLIILFLSKLYGVTENASRQTLRHNLVSVSIKNDD